MNSNKEQLTEHVIRMTELYDISETQLDELLSIMYFYLGRKGMYLHSFLKMIEGLGAVANISAKDPE